MRQIHFSNKENHTYILYEPRDRTYFTKLRDHRYFTNLKVTHTLPTNRSLPNKKSYTKRPHILYEPKRSHILYQLRDRTYYTN